MSRGSSSHLVGAAIVAAVTATQSAPVVAQSSELVSKNNSGDQGENHASLSIVERAFLLRRRAAELRVT